MSRGDVVLVDFPYTDRSGSKVRPALIVQGDRVASVNRIVAPITGQVHRTGPTRLVIDLAVPEAAGSGLRTVSAIACDGLITVHQDLILRTIGRLPASLMAQVDLCLKAALDLT